MLRVSATQLLVVGFFATPDLVRGVLSNKRRHNRRMAFTEFL
jgi:hypothetical protein